MNLIVHMSTYTKYFALFLWYFKSLQLDYPDLAVFAKQRRRTFLPSEVNIIYQHLGHP